MLIVWIIIFSLLGSVGSVGGVTLLAVVAHEIPQEIGDFAVLLDSGYSRQKAFFYNILSSISTLPGAVIAYFFLNQFALIKISNRFLILTCALKD